ncbi:hypothetical protein LEP1GSC137_2197 [Leptospira borgpetersenii str. Noumea 25]|nr:hypothetical protein LEP1GSC137_2197 [Leptospira borgpetersenii str. Noumea 25]
MEIQILVSKVMLGSEILSFSPSAFLAPSNQKYPFGTVLCSRIIRI